MLFPQLASVPVANAVIVPLPTDKDVDAVAEHPAPLLTVTTYKPAPKFEIAADVAPLFHA